MSAFPNDFAKLLPDASSLLTRMAITLGSAATFGWRDKLQEVERAFEACLGQAGSLAAMAAETATLLRTGMERVADHDVAFIIEFSQEAEVRYDQDSETLRKLIEDVTSAVSLDHPEFGPRMEKLAAMHDEARLLVLEALQQVRWASILAADAREPTEPTGRVLATPDDVRAMLAELDEPS